MMLPIITRKKHEKILQEKLLEQKSRITVYVPSPKKPSIGTSMCYHDGRIGWVEKIEFDHYEDYAEFLKNDKPYQAYLAAQDKIRKRKAAERKDDGGQ